MTWRAVSGFRLVVADLDAATGFYRALGFTVGTRQPISTDEMSLLGLNGAGLRQTLKLGPSRLDLDAFADAGRPYPDGADVASLCFQHLALVTSDADGLWQTARMARATRISRDRPVTLPTSAGGVTAIKFRDPDGHPLELLQFPDGAAKVWPGQGLLGIDHSAVSVSDVAASRMFFERQGLGQGHATLNQGPTQVALDGLDGVEVDVVPMQPAEGSAHVELLGYRHPPGRFFGPLAANDIAATRIVWQADRAALLRGPDGHLQQLTTD